MKKDYPEVPPRIMTATVPPPAVPHSGTWIFYGGDAPPITVMNSQSRPEGWMVSNGVVPDSPSHADSPVSKPNITIKLAEASEQESAKSADSIAASGNGASIPSLKASGKARVVKGKLSAKIALNMKVNATLTNGGPSPPIITPPWYRLRNIARIFFGRKFLKTVIEPALADVQTEHYEAMLRYADGEARIIKWRGLVQILWVIAKTPFILVVNNLLRPKAG